VLGIEYPFSDAAPDSVPGGWIAGPTPKEGAAFNDGQGRFYHAPFNTVGAGPYSWGWPTSRTGCAVTLAVSGADPTTPLNVATVFSDDDTSGATWTGPGQTTTVANCCIIGFGGASPDGAGRNYAITGDLTDLGEFQVESHLLIPGFKNQTSAGTATVSGTCSIADRIYTVQYAFAPSIPPPDPVGARPGLFDRHLVPKGWF
jgi:hypothetical protein